MKAIAFDRYGDSDVLRWIELDRPVPGAGEVLVRVAGTSFNPVDAGIRGGWLAEVFPVSFPHVPGIDVAGTVAEIGADVTDLHVGDAVIGMLPMTADGAAAEFVVAPAESLTPAPTSVELADAAALPVVGLTAWQALFEIADLRAGQSVLINGAGGAVGDYAVQLAHQAGAHVTATASDRSADRVRAHGADHVVGHLDLSGRPAVEGAPFDVVLNLVSTSPEETRHLVGLVADGGTHVGTMTAGEPDQARGVTARRVFVRSDAALLADLVRRVDAGTLTVEVGRRVGWDDVAAVHDDSDAGRLSGKVIVLPA
ncbi:NADP-dependent oxidoreductase [Williamsia serinedens]|uniref:NADPH:quinone reductase n=1 Tax=Williamsia serinedens TaxID=391736 RepID=A0ABT1H0K9_9NOCA|nr:NADP-dependent oxidoreductase [Williamsia serinedens]MCP2160068.1 NADPH:quinone reductase [Williamsia serinedens]